MAKKLYSIDDFIEEIKEMQEDGFSSVYILKRLPSMVKKIEHTHGELQENFNHVPYYLINFANTEASTLDTSKRTRLRVSFVDGLAKIQGEAKEPKISGSNYGNK